MDLALWHSIFLHLCSFSLDSIGTLGLLPFIGIRLGIFLKTIGDGGRGTRIGAGKCGGVARDFGVAGTKDIGQASTMGFIADGGATLQISNIFTTAETEAITYTDIGELQVL